MSRYASLLSTATEATALASALIREHRPESLTAKGDRDYASDVDFLVEKSVRAFLASKTPEIGFLGEEEGTTNGDSDLLWSLDPIDGTVNFVHDLPLCAVSLGLIHRKRTVLGVVELPFLDSRYHAIDGEGAYSGTKRLEATKVKDLADAVVAVGDYAVGVDAPRKNKLRLAVTEELAQRVLRIRMFGTAATDLAWLAEGKVDACVILSNNPWDTSAGVILAREAGAIVVDSDGTPHTFDSQATIAGHAPIVGQLVEIIQNAMR